MSRRPLVESPESEFASEARMEGARAREMIDCGEWSIEYARQMIESQAARLAPFYELPAADFVEAATRVAGLK